MTHHSLVLACSLIFFFLFQAGEVRVDYGKLVLTAVMTFTPGLQVTFVFFKVEGQSSPRSALPEIPFRQLEVCSTVLPATFCRWDKLESASESAEDTRH